MKLGKYNIYFLIYFLIYSYQSFGQTINNLQIEKLDDLPSTYEEEDFQEEDSNNKEGVEKIKLKKKKVYDKEIIVEIKALDKISAKTSTLNIKLGEEKFFGQLKIKPLKCKTSDREQSTDIVAYLQMEDSSIKNNDQVYVFNGWTFASSPTLRSLDHAIYDLWLVGCSNI